MSNIAGSCLARTKSTGQISKNPTNGEKKDYGFLIKYNSPENKNNISSKEAVKDHCNNFGCNSFIVENGRGLTEICKMLGKIKNIKFLYLDLRGRLTNNHIDQLCEEIKKLKTNLCSVKLDLTGTDVGNGILEILGDSFYENRNLSSINLELGGEIKKLGRESFNTLFKAGKLVSLKMNSKSINIDNKELDHLGEAIKNLTNSKDKLEVVLQALKINNE